MVAGDRSPVVADKVRESESGIDSPGSQNNGCEKLESSKEVCTRSGTRARAIY